MSINKFQRVVERLMTDEELIERARELKLSDKLTKHIVAVFTNTAEAILDDGEIDEEELAAGNGRMSLYYDYDGAWHDFAIEAGRRKLSWLVSVLPTFPISPRCSTLSSPSDGTFLFGEKPFASLLTEVR